MANYNVDIELTVKGVRQLREFERRIKEIDGEVKELEQRVKSGNTNPFGPSGKIKESVRQVKEGLRAKTDILEKQKKITKSLSKQLEDHTKIHRFLKEGQKIRESYARDAERAANAAKKEADQLQKRRGSAAVTAGAFPLLFGGGPFQAIGGAIGGGLTGNMFGGATVALQVLGGSLDTLTNNAVTLSASLDGAGDASAALEMFIGRLDSATQSRITNLQQSGQTARAADAAFKELSDTIGETSARGIVQAGKDFEFLKDKLLQVSAAISGFILSLGQETFGLVSPDPTATGQKETKEFKRFREDTKSALVIAKLETLEAQAVLDKEIERTAEVRKRIADEVSGLEVAEVQRQHSDKLIDDGIRDNKLKIIQEKLNRELLNIDQQRLTAIKQRTNKEDANAAEAKRKQDQIRRGIDSQLKANERLSMQLLKLDQDKLATQYDGIELLVEQFKIEELLSVLKQRAINAAYERNVVDAKSVEEQQLMLENKNTEIILERQLLELKKKNLETAIAQAQAAERARDLSAAAGFNALGLAAEDRGAFLPSESLYGAPETMFPIEKAIEYDDSLQKILDKYPQIQQTADIAANSMVTGLTSIVEGTKTAEEVFADFLRSVANMLFDAAKQIIATYIAIGIARIFAGMSSGSSGSDILSKSPLGSDGGGIFSEGFNVPAPFAPKALGGSVSSGRPYLVGERGPELFVPGAQGNIVPNSAMGSANVTVNVDASGSSVQGDGQNAAQLGKAIGLAVQTELRKQQRPGGILAR